MSRTTIRRTDLRARGEPALWSLGGALALGVIMIIGFLVLVFANGIVTFIPKPLAVVTETDGTVTAGEPFRSELYKPSPEIIASLSPEWRERVKAENGYVSRTLYRTGNFDIYGEDFRWVPAFQAAKIEHPKNLSFFERMEWGPFVGTVKSFKVGGAEQAFTSLSDPKFIQVHDESRARAEEIRAIERGKIGHINHELETERLDLRKVELEHGRNSAEYKAAQDRLTARAAELQVDYDKFSAEVQKLREMNAGNTLTLAEVGGREKTIEFSALVRAYAANDLSLLQTLGVYFSRWGEFLADEPREANTEGGVFPAIFGTFAMTLLMVIVVAPFGIITALYLREYAKQGKLVSFVRISVNNLAGVPSIVYGVFGLGFFAYVLGGSIDALFYPERLPNPTFGTGGLMWASLTLALLTVPVVIVATEEALAAVPRSMREGSLACGASKWQTIRYIVLPRAMPGILTGVILAMARGAGEVAPLMLVGVVKLAPELPVDGLFPFVHLERSFMHLGFHIFDVGFQSRNAEAGKPMVFVTTVLLIALVTFVNATAIIVRNRLKKKFAGSQF
ncbi:MAG: phosphate ABC transporter permease PstA [Rhodospirillaceae bacterium]|nr:phosphate ABC transporter permease PstA [Rhodospirillaceae bacterium]